MFINFNISWDPHNLYTFTHIAINICMETAEQVTILTSGSTSFRFRTNWALDTRGGWPSLPKMESRVLFLPGTWTWCGPRSCHLVSPWPRSLGGITDADSSTTQAQTTLFFGVVKHASLFHRWQQGIHPNLRGNVFAEGVEFFLRNRDRQQSSSQVVSDHL